MTMIRLRELQEEAGETEWSELENEKKRRYAEVTKRIESLLKRSRV